VDPLCERVTNLRVAIFWSWSSPSTSRRDSAARAEFRHRYLNFSIEWLCSARRRHRSQLSEHAGKRHDRDQSTRHCGRGRREGRWGVGKIVRSGRCERAAGGSPNSNANTDPNSNGHSHSHSHSDAHRHPYSDADTGSDLTVTGIRTERSRSAATRHLSRRSR
jgi:hypothetical protein